MEHVDRIEANITEYDRILSHIAKTDHRSQRLMELKGVGPTTACALVASIGNAHDFKNGRQLAAWLGLTPSQYSSGGKSKLGRITKAGDSGKIHEHARIYRLRSVAGSQILNFMS